MLFRTAIMAFTNLSLKRLNSQFSCLQKLVKRGMKESFGFHHFSPVAICYANTCFVLTPTETVPDKMIPDILAFVVMWGIYFYDLV